MMYFEALFTLICAQHTSQSQMSCETESLKSGIHTVSIFIVPCIVHVTSQTICQNDVSEFFWSYIPKDCI